MNIVSTVLSNITSVRRVYTQFNPSSPQFLNLENVQESVWNRSTYPTLYFLCRNPLIEALSYTFAFGSEADRDAAKVHYDANGFVNSDQQGLLFATKQVNENAGTSFDIVSGMDDATVIQADAGTNASNLPANSSTWAVSLL